MIPLPKQVSLEGRLTLPVSEVVLQLRRHAMDVEQNARDELLELIRNKTGAAPGTEGFRVLAGVCDGDGKIDGTAIPGANRLAALRNADSVAPPSRSDP